MSDSFSPEAFGQSFHGFLQNMAATAPEVESPVLIRLREHFGADPQQFPIVQQEFSQPREPDVQIAVDRWFEREGRSMELLGVRCDATFGATLAELLAPVKTSLAGSSPPNLGPVAYHSISLGTDRTLTSVSDGLYLIRDQGVPFVAYRHKSRGFRGRGDGPVIEVQAAQRETAEAFLRAITEHMRRESVYRGRVLSVDERYGEVEIKFHDLPAVERSEIVLPAGVLERIERQTLLFAAHGPALLAAGRHLRRGILLYGPPGTGKTMTARYIATAAPNRTVLLLTGRGIGNIEKACEFARQLAPATIILEDVDLIAEERTNQAAGCSPLLFDLLNQMDGIGGDSDVIFLLTTNRPELLEPALAARPGRVDMAVEMPLPDADCRRRLFEKYGRGLGCSPAEFEPFVERTTGVSGAFIAELLRRAALHAALRSAPLVVRADDVDEAMRELLVFGGGLQRRLLGARDAIGYRADG